MVFIIKQNIDPFENIPEEIHSPEYIEQCIDIAQSEQVCKAFRFLRGNSGLDVSVLDILKNDTIYNMALEGLRFLDTFDDEVDNDFDIDFEQILDIVEWMAVLHENMGLEED